LLRTGAKTNPDGTPKDPIREKGDARLVDCCVTGSNEGTKKDPKCSLLLVFKELIFPAILNLVGPGKEYEDCHVTIQGDQAGPHENATFSQFVNDFCTEQGWIMGHVIKAGGSNEFVGRMDDGATLHTGIRNDFDETLKGMKPSARHPSNN